MIWHPYTIQKGSPLPIKILKAKDEFVYDEDGKEYIDAISSWWISIHGHNRHELIQAAQEQLNFLDQILLAGFSNHPAEELAKKLLEITNSNFYKVFYSDNGSCANEIALKIALQYYKNLGIKNKILFIKFSLSYHGDTIGAMSVSGNSVFNLNFKEFLFPVKEFPSPDCSYCPVGKEQETCSQECLFDLKKFIEQNKEKIAGIIIEPLVFGASGMRMYKKEVLQDLEKITKENKIILILDEVFTGFGRTGSHFAYEKAFIQPDIITLAKGFNAGILPIAATLISKEIYEAFYSEKVEHAFYHGHTMTGNPIASIVALRSIELYFLEQRILDVQRLESIFECYMIEMQKDFFELIQKPRVLGGILAFELSENINKTPKQIAYECIQEGIILRPLVNTIYVVPPYTIQEDSLKKIFHVLFNKLNQLKKGN